MAGKYRLDVQKFIHANYNAVASPGATKTAGTYTSGTLTVTYPINSLYIENMDSLIDIYVSFDGGTNWKTIKAGAYLSLECDGLKSYVIKSASGTPSVECIYGVEA